MVEVATSPLEDDIRRRANGGEKVVFAQRNPLTEVCTSQRGVSQLRAGEDGRMPRGGPPASPTNCSYSFLQGMCELHGEPGAKKRKPGSGGKFKADGFTPRVVSRIHPTDKAAAAKVAKAKHKECTAGTRVDKDIEAIWTNFGKPEGSLDRWLNKLARAAKDEGAATTCSSTGAEMAAAEVDAEKLKRHKPRDTKDPRINCKSVFNATRKK